MGKKKKKHKKHYGDYSSSMYDQERNEKLADHLEEYANTIDSLFILEGKSVEEVEDAFKIIRKACKDLRDGKPEKVFDEERFEEYLSKHQLV